MTSIFSRLDTDHKKKQWFSAFIYIFNLHWDKVDNFRIDKYLAFLRSMFNEALTFLKQRNFEAKVSNLLPLTLLIGNQLVF